MVSPVQVLVSLQAICGLPCMCAPGIVPCIITFSRQLPCFLVVWPDLSMLASKLWQSLIVVSLLQLCWLHHLFVFFAIGETGSIFFSPFISKASRRLSSFFISVKLSQPYVATGHTSSFISHIFVEICMLWVFHIFCSDAPIACNTVVEKYRVGQNNGLSLRVNNFATFNGRTVCNMSKMSKFCLEEE